MPPRDDGGLGTQLVGDKIAVNHRNVQVTRLLGEGESFLVVDGAIFWRG